MSLSHNWKYQHKKKDDLTTCHDVSLSRSHSLSLYLDPGDEQGKGLQWENRLLETHLKKHGTLSVVGYTQAL